MTADDAWIKAERLHEREMAEIAAQERYDKRHQRTERITAITVGAATVAVVAILAGLVLLLVGNTTEANTRRDADCAASGGTRVQIGGSSGPVVCMHPGGGIP